MDHPLYGSWYIIKINDNYPKPKTIDELNNSWLLSDPSPWISVPEFVNYWANKNVQTLEYSVLDYTVNHSFIRQTSGIKTGDILILMEPVLWWFRPYHAVVLTYYFGASDYIYAGHTRNTNNSTILNDICGNAFYQNFNLRFFRFS